MDIQWPLLIFGLLAGLGMGCLAVASAGILIGKLRELTSSLLWVSLVSLAVGGCISALHMGHMGRVFYVLSNLSSGISKELIATAVAGVILIALLAVTWRGTIGAAAKVLAVCGLAIAVILPLVTGAAYVEGARPAWNTPFLPLMYLGAAAAMGLFCSYLVAVAKKVSAGELKLLGKAAFVAVAAFAVCVALYVGAVAMAPYPDPSRSAARLLSGDLAPLFWGVVVVLGLAVPLVAAGRAVFAKAQASTAALEGSASVAFVAVAFIALLAGSAAIRAIMYLLGSSIQSFIY